MERWIHAARKWKEEDDLTTVEKLRTELEEAGHTATADIPINIFAPAFAELRPKAKVVFNVHDYEHFGVNPGEI